MRRRISIAADVVVAVLEIPPVRDIVPRMISM